MTPETGAGEDAVNRGAQHVVPSLIYRILSDETDRQTRHCLRARKVLSRRCAAKQITSCASWQGCPDRRDLP